MRTDYTLTSVCNALQQNCGDLHDAARVSGISPAALFSWMKDDPEAAKKVEEAQRVGWLGLESAAIRRGVQGVEKAVYYKGQVVGTETQYSDSLLAKLMEARIPAYKKGESANTFNGPTQINIMPRAETMEEWLAMKQATLTRDDPKPLPAPVQDAEYTEVPNDMEALRGLL